MGDYVRLGIIGAGSIALRGHFPHLTMDDVRERVRITAVCDPVLERAQAAAARFGVPAAYATMEELLAAGDVDAVSICSPIGVHYEQGMLAVDHSVHVHLKKCTA
jgi:predicted dehydrogenase